MPFFNAKRSVQGRGHGMDKDTCMKEQKFVRGTASHWVWLQCEVSELGGVGSGIACGSATRSGDTLNNVLRNSEFGYVGNSTDS